MTDIDLSTLSPEVAAYIRSLEKKNSALEEKNQKLAEENRAQKDALVRMQSLNEQLVCLRKRMFGRSSERFEYVDCKQLDFFNEAETYCDAAAPEPGKNIPVAAHSRRAKRTKAELTEGLAHQKVLCELPENEQICAKCGTKMAQIGEKYVRSELIIVPAKISVVDYYVATYKCAPCEKDTGESYIEQAKAPVPVMKKSMAAASTVAYVMQEKFQKGVPLYRQEEYWKGQGIDLRRNTMANWIIRSSKWFVPLWNAFREELLKCDIVNADETRCHVLKEDGRETKQMSEMWVFCSPEKNIALYQYKPSRGGKVAKEMLKGFSGYLQTDGYSAYNAVESVVRVGCWAHARRKWVDCFADKKPVEGSQSEKAFAYVEKIFALEARWKDLSPDERQKHRMAEMKPVMDAYWDFLSSFSSDKDSNLQKAQTYSLNQRKQLEAVLLDGRLELTNNVAERTVKPFVMARKNFLFCDTAKGADASALCFSVIETAKRNQLDPFGYLLYLLQELPKLGEEPAREQLLPLLPWSMELPEYCHLS